MTRVLESGASRGLYPQPRDLAFLTCCCSSAKTRKGENWGSGRGDGNGKAAAPRWRMGTVTVSPLGSLPPPSNSGNPQKLRICGPSPKPFHSFPPAGHCSCPQSGASWGGDCTGIHGVEDAGPWRWRWQLPRGSKSLAAQGSAGSPLLRPGRGRVPVGLCQAARQRRVLGGNTGGAPFCISSTSDLPSPRH